MAKLMLLGAVSHVELTSDPEDGQTIALCRTHMEKEKGAIDFQGCGWTERYDSLDDVAEYAADHADRG